MCGSCNHEISEHFHSFTGSEKGQAYMMDCLLCGKGVDSNIGTISHPILGDVDIDMYESFRNSEPAIPGREEKHEESEYKETKTKEVHITSSHGSKQEKFDAVSTTTTSVHQAKGSIQIVLSKSFVSSSVTTTARREDDEDVAHDEWE